MIYTLYMYKHSSYTDNTVKCWIKADRVHMCLLVVPPWTLSLQGRQFVDLFWTFCPSRTLLQIDGHKWRSNKLSSCATMLTMETICCPLYSLLLEELIKGSNSLSPCMKSSDRGDNLHWALLGRGRRSVGLELRLCIIKSVVLWKKIDSANVT